MTFGNTIQFFVRKFPVLSFCILTFTISWGLKLLYVSIKINHGLPIVNFSLLASFGPSISAILLILVAEGQEGIKRTLKKLTDLTVGVRWILLAALFEPILFFSFTLGYWLSFHQFPITDGFSIFPNIASYIGVFILGIFRWGIAEEIGWRGWMLPKLQVRMSPIRASLILSIVASLWHLDPNNLSNFFTGREGEYLYGYFPEIVERLIVTIPMTMVIVSIFNKTKGNLFIMLIFHSASNTSYFWVDEVFGIVRSDFFKLSFTLVLMVLFIVFSAILMNQRTKVTS